MADQKWFAAHAILWVRFKDGRQNVYPVWENVYLVRANTHDEARLKASQLAAAEQGDQSGSFVWDDRPAEWVFGGVRKTMLCIDTDTQPTDGVELTFSEFEISDRNALEALIRGGEVDIKYVD